MIYVIENFYIPWLQTEMLTKNELQNSAQWLEHQYFLWMLPCQDLYQNQYFMTEELRIDV